MVIVCVLLLVLDLARSARTSRAARLAVKSSTTFTRLLLNVLMIWVWNFLIELCEMIEIK